MYQAPVDWSGTSDMYWFFKSLHKSLKKIRKCMIILASHAVVVLLIGSVQRYNHNMFK